METSSQKAMSRATYRKGGDGVIDQPAAKEKKAEQIKTEKKK